MRIHLKTTPNREPVPFNYQQKLVGVLHKWLGANDLHGNPALYSFSWLLNARSQEKGLNYPEGAKIFISFHDDTYLKQAVKSIMQDPNMFFGMQATDITVEENPDFADKILFQCASPIFIKRNEDWNNTHYTFEHENAGRFLEDTLRYKMNLANLPEDESLKIEFAPSQGNAKVKLIDYRGVKNKVSQCPVIIQGKPETKQFAWNVGLGNSTGVGFGALY